MGNTASSKKRGFYTPTRPSIASNSDEFPQTKSALPSPLASDMDVEAAIALMNLTSPLSSPRSITTLGYKTSDAILSDYCQQSPIPPPSQSMSTKHSKESQTFKESRSNPSSSRSSKALSFVEANTKTPTASKSQKQKVNKYSYIKLDFLNDENYVHDITTIFTYHKQLGCGASCTVSLANDRNHKDALYAVKEMLISDDLNRLLFAAEYKVLNILAGHRNIISFHSAYITEKCYYLSTAYCSARSYYRARSFQ